MTPTSYIPDNGCIPPPRDARRNVTELETYSGHYLDYRDPRPEHIELADIARGLSQICRFGAQTNTYYSVAEHAVFVSRLVEPEGRLAFAALHHDSHEAYLGDWPSPLKYVFDSFVYRSTKTKLDEAIATKLGFDHAALGDPRIKDADIEAMRQEAATLKWSHGTGPHWGWNDAVLPLAGVGWSPTRAEREFLSRHHELEEA